MQNKKGFIGLFLSLLFIVCGTLVLSISNVPPRLSELRAGSSMGEDHSGLARCLETRCRRPSLNKRAPRNMALSPSANWGRLDSTPMYGEESNTLSSVVDYASCERECRALFEHTHKKNSLVH